MPFISLTFLESSEDMSYFLLPVQRFPAMSLHTPWLLQVHPAHGCAPACGQESCYQLSSLKCALQCGIGFVLLKNMDSITLTVSSKPHSLCTLLSQELLCVSGDA